MPATKSDTKYSSTVDEALKKPENADTAEQDEPVSDPRQDEFLALFAEDAEEGLEESPTDEAKADSPEDSEEEIPTDETTAEVDDSQEPAEDEGEDEEEDLQPDDYLIAEVEPEERKSEEELAEEQAKWREDALAGLVDHFDSSLSDEDRDLLLTEPDKILPRILASATLDMYNMMMGAVTQTMPNQIGQYMTQQQVAEQSERAFYARWPELGELDTPDQMAVVERTIQAYRQANPNVSLDQAIEESGAMAMVALRIPFKADTPVEAEKSDSFTPAAPGAGASSARPKAKPKNEYELLADELIADEDM